jgi:hypothetical protein
MIKTIKIQNSNQQSSLISPYHNYLVHPKSHTHPTLNTSPFLPCKDTFMDDYDGIYNCNSLKYNPFEKIDNF